MSDAGFPSDGCATALTAFQLTVATLFFELPGSRQFLLAGGGALAAQRLTCAGFNKDVFAEMIGALGRFADEDLPRSSR